MVEALSKAPEHEMLAYATGLQVIEWAIKVTSKKCALEKAQLIGDRS